jgi:threonine/homoserine/homoserine lactone efflux protein
VVLAGGRAEDVRVPPLSHLLAFAGVALVLVAIPGPSVLFTIGRSISLGRRAGLVTVVGNMVGVSVHVLAVALGLGALVAQSALLFTVVKLAGAAYLVHLGVQTIRRRKDAVAAVPTRSGGTGKLLRQGFLVGVSNPKSIVFLAAVLPQFVAPQQGAIPLQLGVLGAMFLTIGLASDCVWALLAGTARRWFARSPKRIQRLDATGGVLMIGLGGVLATSSKA